MYRVTSFENAQIGLGIIALRKECERRGHLCLSNCLDFTRELQGLIFTSLPLHQAVEQALERYNIPIEEREELWQVFVTAALPAEEN